MSSIEDVTSKIDELFYDVRKYRKSSEFRELIRFVNRFKTLSPFNAMLAHIQRPESRFLLRASDWKKKYDRGIKEDARPIVILVPFGPVDFLFEVGDTYPISPKLDGKDNILDYLAQPYDTKEKINPLYHNILIGSLPHSAIEFKTIRAGANLGGKITLSNTKENLFINIGTSKEPYFHGFKSRFSISINDNATIEAQFSILCHELGHLFCHHLPSPDRWWNQRHLSLTAEEFEAEVVTTLVCGHFGLQTQSEKYLEIYLSKNNYIPIEVSIDTMWTATNDIIKMIENASFEKGLIFRYDKEFKALVKEYRAEKKKNKKVVKMVSDSEKLPELPFES